MFLPKNSGLQVLQLMNRVKPHNKCSATAIYLCWPYVKCLFVNQLHRGSPLLEIKLIIVSERFLHSQPRIPADISQPAWYNCQWSSSAHLQRTFLQVSVSDLRLLKFSYFLFLFSCFYVKYTIFSILLLSLDLFGVETKKNVFFFFSSLHLFTLSYLEVDIHKQINE